ncbi:hypothetical protein HanLR1_Chr15g0564141 [Helianthus annuus]|nr:hypothetical protein HanHA89_Chr10g0399341 [Helianthus annuus]KAJ0647657.1 hypothetical protein HanLR1_Chr15g0564141 [Helianthus annuus]
MLSSGDDSENGRCFFFNYCLFFFFCMILLSIHGDLLFVHDVEFVVFRYSGSMVLQDYVNDFVSNTKIYILITNIVGFFNLPTILYCSRHHVVTVMYFIDHHVVSQLFIMWLNYQEFCLVLQSTHYICYEHSFLFPIRMFQIKALSQLIQKENFNVFDIEMV